MQKIEASSNLQLSTDQLRLLTAIQNHQAEGKGYLLPLEAMVVLRELDQNKVANIFRNLLSYGLIRGSTFSGAYEVTRQGEEYLAQDKSRNFSAESGVEFQRGKWDRFYRE